MSVKIRLARGGSKKKPFYRIVVADIRAPRDGAFIEKLGTYSPLLPKDSSDRFKFNEERVKYWIAKGAQPTDAVKRYLVSGGIIEETAKDKALKAKAIAKYEAAKKIADDKAAAEKAAKDAEEAEAQAAKDAAEAEAKAAEEAAAAPAEEAKAEEAPAAEEKSE